MFLFFISISIVPNYTLNLSDITVTFIVGSLKPTVAAAGWSYFCLKSPLLHLSLTFVWENAQFFMFNLVVHALMA
jgi:hypothetical protein